MIITERISREVKSNRLKKHQVANFFNITCDELERIMKTDESFPAPYVDRGHDEWLLQEINIYYHDNLKKE